MNSEQLCKLTVNALEEIKAIEVRVLDVRDKSNVTDIMVIASGNTSRQVKSLSQNLLKCAQQAGIRPLGIEGEQYGEWILVDLGDVVAHIMVPEIRDFYNLEKLWGDDSPAVASE